MYENHDISAEKQFNGFKNSIINHSFEWENSIRQINEHVQNIIVMFGGTDPSSLTELALNSLKNINFSGSVTLVQGMGNKSKVSSLEQYNLKGEIHNNVKFMPQLMKKADLAISSAGRSISEFMICSVPTICLCQNEKIESYPCKSVKWHFKLRIREIFN